MSQANDAGRIDDEVAAQLVRVALHRQQFLAAQDQLQVVEHDMGRVRAPGAGLVEPLSAREMEVLALVNRRLSNKEVAASLVVSPLTVKRHMTNIMQKLGVDSRWEAVERAREIGLIPPS